MGLCALAFSFVGCVVKYCRPNIGRFFIYFIQDSFFPTSSTWSSGAVLGKLLKAVGLLKHSHFCGWQKLGLGVLPETTKFRCDRETIPWPSFISLYGPKWVFLTGLLFSFKWQKKCLSVYHLGKEDCSFYHYSATSFPIGVGDAAVVIGQCFFLLCWITIAAHSYSP